MPSTQTGPECPYKLPHVGMTASAVLCAEGGTAQQAVGVAAARAFTSGTTQAQAVARSLATAIALYGCPAIQPLISSAPLSFCPSGCMLPHPAGATYQPQSLLHQSLYSQPA